MKPTLIILLIIFLTKQFSICQPPDNMIGNWKVTFEGFVSQSDTLFLADSYGNITDEIHSIDKIYEENPDFKLSTWKFNKENVLIYRLDKFGNLTVNRYKFKFVESGLILKSDQEENLFLIEELEDNRLVLIYPHQNSLQNVVELIKE